MIVSPESISIGGNRNPAAADWDEDGLGFLAFGADNSIALWDPLHTPLQGIHSLLSGHTKNVNAVTFFPTGSSMDTILLSGSADHTIRIWRRHSTAELHFRCVKILSEHQAAITQIATLKKSDVFVTGAADGTVKIWKLMYDENLENVDTKLLQTITLSPKYFPLTLSLASLDELSLLLAVGGTKSAIQIFISKDTQFEHAATLTGHEGWIRALDFTHETNDEGSDILLASASQDKYIRLWRVHRGEELPAVSSALSDPALGVLGKSLSNKAHRIQSATTKYSITFEALLLGHEDWIYTATWRRRNGKLQLLSTSEDNSLSIWESDSTSGVWICTTRLGEISAQKGSTTATGSAGGFWIGLWSPDSNTVVSLGRTGSWRMWAYNSTSDLWEQKFAITGHVRAVQGLCWSRDGSYLLSTSSDQTTRLWAEWKRDGLSSWHEFSRPQIHGYDLNCIASITPSQFLTGADEKLLRVFDEPKGVSAMLHKLCAIATSTTTNLPDAANIPVLGLSNKAIQAIDDNAPPESADADEYGAASVLHKSTLDYDHPPFEDHLARHLLWPESEKLYGHGFEISAVATSPDGKLVATSCRASSLDHAVIRLYDTEEWLEIKPPLKAHSLTVTALQFSADSRYLLSVGRDRQWVVWARKDADGEGVFELAYSNPKGHSRMILDASWTDLQQPTFLTAGRDKTVKIWALTDTDGNVELRTSITATAPVTSIQAAPGTSQDRIVFAYGLENGEIWIGSATVADLGDVKTEKVDERIAPMKPINQIVWRPTEGGGKKMQIAVASDDCSVRIFGVDVGGLV